MATPSRPGAAVKKDCLSCAASLGTSDQRTNLGRDFGAPICGVKMLMLQRPGVSNNHTAKQAAACDQFTKTKAPTYKEDARTAPILINIGMPYIRKPDEEDIDEAKAKDVTSCQSCRFFSNRIETKAKLGWESGYCLAKGSLLLDDRLWVYARGCEDKEAPIVRDDNIHDFEVRLFPEFTDEYGRLSPIQLLKRLRLGTKEDPRTAEPDKAASDKAASMGIRGWRRIKDQKGKGPDIYLPMFDVSKLTDDQRAAVPTREDQEAPHLYLDHGNYGYRVAVMWARLKETPALWGPAGVGKTELFRHMAWLMSAPFTRISVTESTELDDLAGKMMYSPEMGTYFHYGVIPTAWRSVNVLCIDEPNTGQPAVWQFIRPMTDNSKQLVLDQNKNERIEKNPFCYPGMAMNPSWDPRNVGTQVIGDADGSRLMHISMGLPPAELESEIIRERLQLDRLPVAEIEPIVATVMNIAAGIRDLSMAGQIDTSWGIRHQIKVARAKPFFSWVDAYALGVTDSLDPGQAQAILDVVRSHVTDED